MANALTLSREQIETAKKYGTIYFQHADGYDAFQILCDMALRALAPQPDAVMEDKRRLKELERLHKAALPFVMLLNGTSGRIPTERLSFANWHELAKAHNDCSPPSQPDAADQPHARYADIPEEFKINAAGQVVGMLANLPELRGSVDSSAPVADARTGDVPKERLIADQANVTQSVPAAPTPSAVEAHVALIKKFARGEGKPWSEAELAFSAEGLDLAKRLDDATDDVLRLHREKMDHLDARIAAEQRVRELDILATVIRTGMEPPSGFTQDEIIRKSAARAVELHKRLREQPGGTVRVPVEPTPDMCFAGGGVNLNGILAKLATPDQLSGEVCVGMDNAKEIYRAMLAAAKKV